MKKASVFASGSILIALVAALIAGCHHDDAKLIDVPRKDISKEMYNKPIPAEAFKSMSPALRKEVQKKGAEMFSHESNSQTHRSD